MTDEIFISGSKVRFRFRFRLFLVSNGCSKSVSAQRIEHITEFILNWESPGDISCSWDLDEGSSNDKILYRFRLKLSCSWSVCKEKMLVHDCTLQSVFSDGLSCRYHLGYRNSRGELSVSQLTFVCLHSEGGSWGIEPEIEFASVYESTLREEVEISWIELGVR